MTLEQAQQKAQHLANRTGSSQLVYRSKINGEYGVDVTLPIHAERIGDRIYNTIDVDHGNGIITLAQR